MRGLVHEELTYTTEQLETKLIEIRYNLHQEPEISNEEFETTKKLRNWLGDLDINILDLPLKTGLVAEVCGDPNGPVVAIRGDIDALPIHEETTLPYKSRFDGKMHACGHDFHTTAVLGAAYVLKQKEHKLKGTVRIIFQPAEETGPGAIDILNTHAIDDVQAIFGLHNMPSLELGQLGTRIGAMSSNCDRFEIVVEGVGTHAAHPDLGVDTILVAGHIMVALQSIVSRNIDWQDSAVVSICQLHSGNTWNVIPSTAQLEGTVRSFDLNIREKIKGKIKQVIEGIASAFGAKATFIWHDGSPAVMNDEKWTLFTIKKAKEVGFEVIDIKPPSSGEDFSHYQEKIPGTFVHIGTSTTYPLHHPKFEIDDRALMPSVRLLATLAEQAILDLKS